MKSMRLLVTALCAIALSSAFAQGPTDAENAANVKVVAAAQKYNDSADKKLALGDAIASFEAIVKEFPTSGSANGWLGFLYLKNKEAGKAICSARSCVCRQQEGHRSFEQPRECLLHGRSNG